MVVPETVDKLLKDINKETGLPWYYHSTVVEPLPIGVTHKIICGFPVRGGWTGYKMFKVQDDLLVYMNDEIIRYLKEEVEKARKGDDKQLN